MTPEVARRRQMAPVPGSVERRQLGLTVRASQDPSGFTVSGYASTTGQPYDMGPYFETIARGAFAKTLAGSPDVQLLINHEGLPMARTTNGSLVLREDDTGLAFEARLDRDEPAAAQLVGKIRSGLLSECSFAFRVTRQTWDEDFENREINEVDMNRGDVSIVNYGANPRTPVSVRSARHNTRGPDLDTYRARAWASRSRAR